MNIDKIEWFNPLINNTPVISIATYGITIQKEMVKTIVPNEYIKFGFCENNLLLAITSSHDECAIKIDTENRKGKYIRISNKSFVKLLSNKFKIEFDKHRKRYQGFYDATKKMFVFKML